MKYHSKSNYLALTHEISFEALSVNGKRKHISMHDFITLAQSMNIKRAERIVLEISNKVASWNRYAEEIKVHPDLRDAINRTLIRMKSY